MKYLKDNKNINYFKIFFILFLMFQFNFISVYAEKIKNYKVSIQINKNGTLTVNEIIDYEFDEKLKHGIYRDIPLNYKKLGFEMNKTFIKMNSIKRNGQPEEYTKKKFFEGIRYRVGSESTYVNSVEKNSRYEFNYTVYNAISKNKGIHQIYYNAIGQFWTVPIENADVIISFENNQKIEKNEIEKIEVSTGSYGEIENNYEMHDDNGKIIIKSTEEFSPDTGLTFLLNLKTDKIKPSILDKIKILFTINPFFITGPLVLLLLTIYSFVTWLFFGKDPAKKAIIPEFNIPKGISAMYAAYVNGIREPREILSVGVMSLLSKGYIKAEDEEGNGKNVKYTKVETENGTVKEKLYEEEKIVLEALSSGQDGIFSDSRNLYKSGSKVLNLLSDRYSKVTYQKNYMFLIPFFLAVPILLFVTFAPTNKYFFQIFDYRIILFFLPVFFSLANLIIILNKKILCSIAIIITLMLSIKLGAEMFILALCYMILFIVYFMVIGKYTDKGLREKEYLKGMKMYIKTAEENKIQKFNDVDELVEYFKGILPYAVALGVKNEAIKLMEKSIRLNNFEESGNYVSGRVHMPSYYYSDLTRSLSREYNKAYEKISEENFRASRSHSGGGFSGGRSRSGGGSGGGGGGSW